MPQDAAEPFADGSADQLYLVDATGFLFRAFHALPPLSRPDGTAVNALLGFVNLLLRLRDEHRAGYAAVAFDAGRRNFRHDLSPTYKANRGEYPGELLPQLALARDAADAFGIARVELAGYEADDLIAAYARLAEARGMAVTIVSVDKDLMQLVGPRVRLYDALKRRAIGPDEVRERFGVDPDRLADLLALAGDSSDNVAGVPGIGAKIAAELIDRFGSLEALLAHAGEITQPKRRQALIEHADTARLAHRLIALTGDAPVPLPLEALAVREPDRQRLLRFLREQDFRGVAARLEGLWKESGGLVAVPEAGAPETVDRDGYELVQSVDRLEAWVGEAVAAGVVAVDTETDGLRPSSAKLVGVSLAVEPGRACYIPLGHVDPGDVSADELDLGRPPPRQIPLADAAAVLRRLFENPAVLKVGHNLKFDMQVLAQERHGGMRLAPIDDTMLISYVLDGGAHGHGLDELAELHLGHTNISFDEVAGSGRKRVTFDRVPLDQACRYAAEDADVALRLYRLLQPRLAAEGMTAVYETIERPLVPIIAAMERRGVLVDPDRLTALSRDFAERLVALEAEIHVLAGRAFNIGSPKQLGEVLFGEVGLPGGRRGRNGSYSTDSAVLEPLAAQGHEIAARVLDWRQLARLKNTYADALREEIDPRDGRVHTSFSMVGASTGRLASTDPNLQNIPIRTEEGRKIRAAFVAPAGRRLVSVDYSQIELRLIAEMAGVELLQRAFRDGLDVHALTAQEVFGVPADRMTPELRRRAKTINYAIMYGVSGFGLGARLGIDRGEASLYIRQYLKRFHEVADYMERTKSFCRRHGYVTTLFGRRIHIPGINSPDPGRRAGFERQAINAPIQGTAADIIKRAMIAVEPALQAAGLRAGMLLQVHDELLFEVPDAEIDATVAVVRRVMEGAADLEVPLLAEAGVGESWAAAH